MSSQQTVDAVIKAHGAHRRLDLAVLHPKGRKPRQAGHARRRLIGVIEVPQVADVQPRAELFQHVGQGQVASGHAQRSRGLTGVGTIAAQAILCRAAGVDQLFVGLAGSDQ
ncbi:hypothetical protein D3C76_998690 [compost metagenome]